ELERLELEEFFQNNSLPEAIDFEKQPIDQSRHREILTTAAVVIVSLTALKVLAAWLLTSKESDRTETIIEEVDKKGNIIKRHIIKKDTSIIRPPEDAIVKQLAQLFNVDPTVLLELVKGGK